MVRIESAPEYPFGHLALAEGNSRIFTPKPGATQLPSHHEYLLYRYPLYLCCIPKHVAPGSHVIRDIDAIQVAVCPTPD